MKKLMLLLFICYPFLVLNAQQQQTRDEKEGKINPDSIFVLKSDTYLFHFQESNTV